MFACTTSSPGSFRGVRCVLVGWIDVNLTSATSLASGPLTPSRTAKKTSSPSLGGRSLRGRVTLDAWQKTSALVSYLLLSVRPYKIVSYVLFSSHTPQSMRGGDSPMPATQGARSDCQPSLLLRILQILSVYR
ncbi:hypothetical protein E2C01_063824 [Portunus trituberculatus]|uniref:Uncharacterized protein n=1 Tax=Portunus trituberculatus TaxID=210409 RepID=A0A5B7HJ86_PORTR|nr:hypothetical protein [Portunus trituberculatus]